MDQGANIDGHEAMKRRRADLVTGYKALPTPQARLARLVEETRTQPRLPPELRTEDRLVPGCLARLWLTTEMRDGCCHFVIDSDSTVVRGIAGLLARFYSGLPPEAVIATPPDFLVEAGFQQHLSGNRRDALAQLWSRMAGFARAQREGGNEVLRRS